MFYKDKNAPLEVYNDLNSNLVNLFRCAKYHRAELQKEISGYYNSREMFEDIKARLRIHGFTDIQRAAMFYVLIKISYGAEELMAATRKIYPLTILKRLKTDCRML